MNLSRRSFLDGVIAVEPVDAPDAPTVVGDGIHDDADGIEAMFSGQPVRINGETVIVHEGEFDECLFFISRPVSLMFAGEWEIDEMYIATDQKEWPNALVNFSRHSGKRVEVHIGRVVLDLPPDAKFSEVVRRHKVH